MTEMASTWDNILDSGIYPRDDLEKEGEEAMLPEMKDAIASIVRHEMTSKILNEYHTDANSDTHCMWVPKLEPTKEYDMGQDPNVEPEAEGMD